MDIKLFDTPPFLSFNLSITRILFHYFRTTNINHRLRYREILMLTFYEMSILQVGTEHFLFGDISVDSYVMVESVTHSFKNGIHIMDLDLRYNEPIGNYQIIQNSDAEAVAKIQSKQKTKSGGQTLGGVPTGATGTSAQVDTAFAMNEGRVSPYGSVGCADAVTSAGSYYNADLAEEYKKGTVSVPVLRSNLENKGYITENYNGYANKGDLLIYGDNDHVVISDGSGGCFGSSSSAGYARSYSDVNYAYGDGEPPTKIIRMGVN